MQFIELKLSYFKSNSTEMYLYIRILIVYYKLHIENKGQIKDILDMSWATFLNFW